jgi:hypothetical protein
MTSSHNDNAVQMGCELRMWWTLLTEARTLYRQDPFDPRLLEYIDELEVLHDMTEWPRLKTLCAQTMIIGAEKLARAAAQRMAEVTVQCPPNAAASAIAG